MSWLNERSFDQPEAAANEAGVTAAAPEQGAPAPAPAAPAATAQGPVVITANEQVWIQVRDGPNTLKAGLLEAGQSFEVPATATAPVLTTGKPEALRISVGTADAPAVGPAATTVRNVSLLGPDLMRGPAAAAPGAPPATSPPIQNTAG